MKNNSKKIIKEFKRKRLNMKIVRFMVGTEIILFFIALIFILINEITHFVA